MSQQPQPDPFATIEAVPSISFKDLPIGTTFTGKVIEAPALVQSRDIDTGQRAFWSDGNPKMSVVTKLALTNGEERALWAKKPSAMFRAIADAQKAAGAQIQVGGTLSVTFTGEQRNPEKPNLNPQKLYTAAYNPPNAFGEARPVDPWATAPGFAQPPTDFQNRPDLQPTQQSRIAQPAPPQYTPEQYAAAKAAGIHLPGA
jgi:hypothetical protein